MKIEMGESLMLSWLKHAKGCKITQLNWKPSTHWDSYNEEEVKHIINLADAHFSPLFSTKLFKNNKPEQILLQAEIDVLGINTDENALYAIDIAFHEGGLVYGSKDETQRRITSKIIRSALILYSQFNIKKGEIIFASPKIYPAQHEPLKNSFEQVNNFMTANGFEFNFKLIGNEDFEEKILNPIILLSSQVSDTSELFMRAFQLYNLFSGNNNSKNNDKKKLNYKKLSENSEYSEFKIGALVRQKMNYLFENNILSNEEILNLQDVNYSKKVFGLSFPLLIKIDKAHPNFHLQRLDSNGRARYWSEIFGNKYYVCNHWYEKNKPFFEKWLEIIQSNKEILK